MKILDMTITNSKKVLINKLGFTAEDAEKMHAMACEMFEINDECRRRKGDHGYVPNYVRHNELEWNLKDMALRYGCHQAYDFNDHFWLFRDGKWYVVG